MKLDFSQKPSLKPKPTPQVSWVIRRSATVPLALDLIFAEERPWWMFWRRRVFTVTLGRQETIYFYQVLYKHATYAMILEPDPEDVDPPFDIPK